MGSRVLRLLHTKMASMNAPREVEENMEETSRFQQNFGRLSVWEVLGIVSTFRQNVERMKLYRATLSVVRFMAVLNFIYTVVGTAFFVIGLDGLTGSTYLEKGSLVALVGPLRHPCGLGHVRGLNRYPFQDFTGDTFSWGCAVFASSRPGDKCVFNIPP